MIKFLLLFLSLGSLACGFDIPKGSHDLGGLEEAQAKAGTKGQPLAFVIVEKEATPT